MRATIEEHHLEDSLFADADIIALTSDFIPWTEPRTAHPNDAFGFGAGATATVTDPHGTVLYQGPTPIPRSLMDLTTTEINAGTGLRITVTPNH